MTNKLVDTSYLSLQDRATLGEDAQYLPEVEAKRPTIFFRPGDRTRPEQPGYWIVDETGQQYLGFISQYGSHETQTAPEFLERMPVKVVSREAKRVSEVVASELQKAYVEISSQEKLEAWLQQKYPKQVIDANTIVTVYTIEYV